MNARLLSLLLSLFPLFLSAQTVNIDSLFRVLDEAIEQSPGYVAQRQADIARMEKELANVGTDKERYDISHRLYEAYKAFVNDSAFYYLQQCATIAEHMGDASLSALCRAQLSYQCSNTGLYNEALFYLRDFRTDGIDQEALGAYYRACNHVYGELAFYGKSEQMREECSEKAAEYEILMLQNLNPDSREYLQRMEQTCLAQGNIEESMRYNDQWMKKVEKGTHAYALTAFYRYLEYSYRNDTTEMIHWLVESSIADVRNAIMDQGSMWELANHLMACGDLSRAYRYIAFASDCATRFGTRLRSWQISPVVTAIDKQYHASQEREQLRNRLFICAVSLLALLILVSLIYVSRQRRRLAAANRRASDANQQLSALNDEMKESNEQLTALNKKLEKLNLQLTDSNYVKEEYVGLFLRQCSTYIDKMDEMRRKTNRMVKNHEYEALYQLTRSQESKDRELEELYVTFDNAFLHLFPDFVADFNALLKPEERIQPEEKGRLSTGLRIFALIRLGITDSSKIAEFLHYSVNTIYNYRARIKNGAASDRDNFEKNVRKIGSVEEFKS